MFSNLHFVCFVWDISFNFHSKRELGRSFLFSVFVSTSPGRKEDKLSSRRESVPANKQWILGKFSHS